MCGGITRFLISLFHVIIGAGAGMGVVYTMVRWGFSFQCLPPMVQVSGGIFEMKNMLPGICESMIICLSAVFFFNLLMCAFINCLWELNCFVLVTLFLTTVMGIFVAFCATLFLVYEMVWCDNLMQYMSILDSCYGAAHTYDKIHNSSNMTTFYHHLELQTIGLWSLVPFFVVIILLYAIAMRMSASNSATPPPPTVIIQDAPTETVYPNEATPLLRQS